jgi:hypothetical protein
MPKFRSLIPHPLVRLQLGDIEGVRHKWVLLAQSQSPPRGQGQMESQSLALQASEHAMQWSSRPVINVAVWHIMVRTTDIATNMQQWASFARANNGRAWIWVPQVNGVDEQPALVTQITTAVGSLPTKKVVRERVQAEASKTPPPPPPALDHLMHLNQREKLVLYHLSRMPWGGGGGAC